MDEIHCEFGCLAEKGCCICFHCGHAFCPECLANCFSHQNINMNDGYVVLHCPKCNVCLTDQDVELFDKDLAKKMDKMNLGGIEITTCPYCKYQFIYEPGIEAGIHTAGGKEITGKALTCLIENRCTCSNCRQNFCVNCGAKPFHDGITCKEQICKEEGIVCRFCGEYYKGAIKAQPELRVCSSEDCKKYLKEACTHICECGHPCSGLKDEKDHVGCGLCSFEVCCICGDQLNVMPSIKLKCGHICHKKCAEETITGINSKGLIKFPICKYPGCEKILESQYIDSKRFIDLHKKIEALIPELIKSERVNDDPHVKNEADKDYYKQPEKFIWDKFLFFLCDKCNNPYFGGHKECFQEIEDNVPHLCDNCSKIYTFCPNHQNTILKIPQKGITLKCSVNECPNIYCESCHRWHKMEDACDVGNTEHKCPRCGRLTVKEQGCNRITCICGAHWCYKCGAGPYNTASECYAHLNEKHGGYWT